MHPQWSIRQPDSDSCHASSRRFAESRLGYRPRPQRRERRQGHSTGDVPGLSSDQDLFDASCELIDGQDLVQEEGVFQTLIQEYGSAAAVNSSSVEPEENPDAIERMTETSEGSVERPETKQKGGKLLLDEERETGEIAWKTYKHYLQAIGTWWWSLIILVSIVSVEATRTTNSLFLGFWASDHFEGLTTGAYMGIYAGKPIADEVSGRANCVTRTRWRYCFVYSKLFSSALARRRQDVGSRPDSGSLPTHSSWRATERLSECSTTPGKPS